MTYSRVRRYSNSSLSCVAVPLDSITPPPSPYSTYTLNTTIHSSKNDHCNFQSTWMQGTHESHNPLIRVENIHEFDFVGASPYDPSFSNTFSVPYEWQQMYLGGQNSVGPAAQTTSQNAGSFRDRGHRRQASDSTIASTGPDSPYIPNNTHPFIVNSDRSPAAAFYYPDDSSIAYGTKSFGDHFPSFASGYMPSQLSHMPAAHSAMKDMAIDHHSTGEDAPDFASSRHSATSSRGRNTPSTPHINNSDDSEDRAFRVPSNGKLAVCLHIRNLCR